MVFTEHRVRILWDALMGLSRCHSQGAFMVSESGIAKESGFLERDVHTIMLDAEGLGWVTTDRTSARVWRLSDRVVTVVTSLRSCDFCRELHGGLINRALAEARTTQGRWANVCADHFVSEDCNLGPGLGQFLRLDY